MKIRKPVVAFLILLILIAILTAAIVIVNFIENRAESDFRNDLVFRNTVQSLKMIEKEINRVEDSAKQKTKAGVDLTVSVLKTVSKGTYYSGPRIFDDGVIVQIINDRILYPPSFPWHFEAEDFKPLSTEALKKGLSFEPFFMVHNDSEEKEIKALTTGRITDDLWYIDLTSEQELSELYNDEDVIFDTIMDLQDALDGYILLFDSKTPDLKIVYAPPEFEDLDNAADLGISIEDIEAGIPIASINDQIYSAYYTSLRLFSTPLTAVILIDSTSKLDNIIKNTRTVMLLMLISVTAVILWLYWIQTYVRDHELTESQQKEYHPGHVRRVTRTIGLIGMFLFFLIAAALESLGNLSLESAKNNKILDLIESRMSSDANMVSRFREDEESWAVYYANRLAQLITDNPEFKTRDFFSEANDLLGYEFIMLFDENGNEILSSNSYADMNMETDLSESGNEFRRLLQGVPSVIREPETSLIDGKSTQFIGVPVFSPENEIKGALVIAMDPERSWHNAEREDYSTFINMITPKGSYAFVVDKDSGLITYTNDKDFEGKRASDIGLYGSDFPETDLDSFRILNDQIVMDCYGAYQKDEQYQYYYMTSSGVFQNNVLPFGFVSAIGFLLIYWIVTSFMLRPYRTDVYNEAVRISDSTRQDTILDGSANTEWLKLQNDDSQEKLADIWRSLLPEKKIAVFIQTTLALILITAAAMLFGSGSSATGTVIEFIMQGTWRRGINLLSFAGILILIISFVIFVLFKNLILNLISNILDRKAETVFRLAFSIIQYAAIIALLFFAFDFLGFDTRALLASVSLLSLAVSLGAKDLVADILAGIFIIFEDDFHVGDIIEVNGFSGIVQEIGVRSTKLIGIGDNIKILGNQSVKNVLNMSKMNSWYSIDLKVPADQPLKEIEAMLNAELPAIGKSIPEIISGPYYKGVMAIGGINTLYIIAECRQSNYRRVQRELNHAILMLFDEHGYRIS